MKKLKTILFFPVFSLIVGISLRKKDFYKDSENSENWCIWKKLKFNKFSLCKIFIGDRAFRNLCYYRSTLMKLCFAKIFPGYDHLQLLMPKEAIGGGLIIQHGFASIFSAKKIGENCKVYQQVTLGYNHKLENPTLGDNVEVCCGAKIIGGVKIGNNVLIGANALVVKDVPDNCVVAGVPAKIIGYLKPEGDIFERVILH